MAKKDYYSVLSVRREASDKEIKQTYRRLARQYHPDVNPGDASAEQKFKEISEAYAVLSNPNSRKKYDRFGHQAFATGFDPGFATGGGFGGGQVAMVDEIEKHGEVDSRDDGNVRRMALEPDRGLKQDSRQAARDMHLSFRNTKVRAAYKFFPATVLALGMTTYNPETGTFFAPLEF